MTLASAGDRVDGDDCRAGTGEYERGAGLAPDQGIPLPFVSYGGFVAAGESLAVGILLNISQQAS